MVSVMLSAHAFDFAPEFGTLSAFNESKKGGSVGEKLRLWLIAFIKKFRKEFKPWLIDVSRKGVYGVVAAFVVGWLFFFAGWFFPWAPWVAIVGFAFGYIILFSEIDEDEEEQGARWATTQEAVEALGQRKAGAGIRLGELMVYAPTLEFPDLIYNGENHLITFGKPGSGKGIRTIIPNLLWLPRSCIVIDPKGQNAAVTARARGMLGNKVFILNPYNVLPDHLNGKGEHVTNCARYNPLDRIDRKSVNFVGDVGSLAQALIIHQGGDSHWPDAARELVAALIMHVCISREGNTRNLGEVRALLNQPLEGFALTLADMMQSGFPPLVQKAAQFSEGTNEIKSIISTARTQLAFLDDTAVCNSLAVSDFRFANMKREAITVYLVLPFKQFEAQARWLRLLITSAIEELTEEPRPGDGRVLFMLDEFAQLGRLQAIERALALVRGYGVQLWPFLQDLPQLKGVYPDRWESFLATAGVAQFYTPNDNTTAEYVSKRCGQRLKKRKTVSANDWGKPLSTSSAEHWEPLFSPWELYGKEFHGARQMLFVEGLSPVVYSYREKPYYGYGSKSDNFKPHDPDPFHIPAPE